MKNYTNKLSRLSGETSRNWKSALKKAVMTAVTVSALTFGAGNLTYAAETNLTTVYYVYLQDRFIGIVPETAEIEKVVNERLSAIKEEYKDLDVELEMDVSFIPEQVFRSASNVNTDKVIETLTSQMSPQAMVSALVIDEKPVAFLKDEQDSKEVIRQLMLDYVTEEELEALEIKKHSPNIPLPITKESETRLLDVHLSKNVSFSEEKVEPKKILTVDKAVKLLKKGTLEEKKYKVKDGDVLGTIANSHDLKLEQLLSLNPSLKEDSVLKPGQELNVTVLQPFVNVIVDKQFYQEDQVAFEKEVVTDSSMFKGDTKVKQKGKPGQNGVVYTTSEENGKTVKKKIVTSKVLKEPVKEVIVKGTKVIPSRGDGRFIWPTSGGYVSSQQGYRWNRMHKGIDIARPSNYTIKAADNGVVVSASYDGGYGNKIVIDHQNGYRTVYAHLSSMAVRRGQSVQQGTQIGVMGRTGDSTGVHLHFEVYQNGRLINPMSVLR